MGDAAMSYQATVYDVMIASPGDVQTERDIAREVVYEWNNVHSRSRQIVLQPTGWETHASPSMEDRAQGVINYQILKHCDLLVAIFWTRLGTPTGKAASGTVEEIEEHLKAGKPAMIYFSCAPVQIAAVDRTQYDKLMGFKQSLQQRGLTEGFSTSTEFRDKFRRQLASKINDHPYFAKTALSQPQVNISPLGVVGVGVVSLLSVQARQLLLEASKDHDGRIQVLESNGGRIIRTHEKVFFWQHARERALGDKALTELNSAGLIALESSTSYLVTAAGFEVADSLVAEEGWAELT